MIRIYSIQQALNLKGSIPELAIIRSIQFMGDGYSPEEHGHIVVLENGDDLTQIKEIGNAGITVDELPAFEIVEAFVDGDQITFELVYQLDDERTVAVIADAACLDTDLVKKLLDLSPPLQPLPTLERRAL